VFLNGQRIDPKTDGRPDPRPDVRENMPQLGDLVKDFFLASAAHAIGSANQSQAGTRLHSRLVNPVCHTDFPSRFELASIRWVNRTRDDIDLTGLSI
jgi:hypothetical protein